MQTTLRLRPELQASVLSSSLVDARSYVCEPATFGHMGTNLDQAIETKPQFRW